MPGRERIRPGHHRRAARCRRLARPDLEGRARAQKARWRRAPDASEPTVAVRARTQFGNISIQRAVNSAPRRLLQRHARPRTNSTEILGQTPVLSLNALFRAKSPSNSFRTRCCRAPHQEVVVLPRPSRRPLAPCSTSTAHSLDRRSVQGPAFVEDRPLDTRARNMRESLGETIDHLCDGPECVFSAHLPSRVRFSTSNGAPLRKVPWGDGPRNEVALHGVTAQITQELELVLTFDAFGCDREPDGMGGVDDPAHEQGVRR